MGSVEIAIAAGLRTPIGRFGGAVATMPMTDLAAHAARATLQRAEVSVAVVDHIIFATTVPTDSDSLFAPRVVALKSGLAVETGALGVTRGCASGLQAIIAAAQQIREGHSRLALAGGADCYSRVPYALAEARWGARRGAVTLCDMLDWAYRCPLSGEFMGETAENLAAEFGYGRVEMDEWAEISHARALSAREAGFLASQIAPVYIGIAKGKTRIEHDETPRADTTRERLASLPPVFREGGTVTAGNSSTIADGAGFVLVGERRAIDTIAAGPRARLVEWHVVGVPPRIMGHGPVPAIRGLLERTGLALGDIDYFEVNEAFAVVNLHVERMLGIPREIHNLYGGGISLGHPPALTGIRMALTAMHHLERTQARRAVVALCVGAGQGMAVLLERLT